MLLLRIVKLLDTQSINRLKLGSILGRHSLTHKALCIYTTFTSILFNSFFDELNHIKVDVLSIQCSYIHVIGLYLSQPYYP